MMRRVSSREAAAVGGVLLIICLAAAISIDVVKTGFGLKGDEATYVSMALSLAYDHDLTYERRDLDRFFGLYRSGPDGIFLKKGKRLRVRLPDVPEHRADDRALEGGGRFRRARLRVVLSAQRYQHRGRARRIGEAEQMGR